MKKFQILVVEDDAPVRNLITTTLRAHDYRFITSGTGEGAVMEVASHNPDIILLDLGLPDIDGVDAVSVAGQTFQSLLSAQELRIMIKLMHWMPVQMII